MFYKYDEKRLGYVKINWPQRLIFALGFVSLILIVILTIGKIDEKITESRILVILTQRDQFSSEKLVKKIKEMHIMFPYIVYAQAMLETNNFKSSIFIENNNLFGMKEATMRINMSKGTNREHAIYNNWMDSVYDYGYYQATYLSKIQTEEDYFAYLGQYYAEDSGYVSKIKNIIEKENLKELFK